MTAPTAAQSADVSKGAALLERGGCQGCHGANLSTPIGPEYPKLAGQYADYVYNALRAYKTQNKPQIGRSNPIMGGMVAQFSDDELKELAKYIESLPSTLHTVQPARFR